MDQDKEQMMKNALPKGAILNSGQTEYRIEEVLGAGGFGITYRASANINIGHITKRFDFAIKEHFMKGCYRGSDKKSVLYPETFKNDIEQGRLDFEAEAKRLYELGRLSQHIVKVNESFKANGTFYYVMEYLEGGDLEKYIRKNKGSLSEADAVALLVPIARAVDLLHSGEKPLLHLDIKPDNIVMKRDEVSGLQIPVLIDFGAAKHFDKKGKPTSLLIAKAATPGFAPIEQYGPITEFDARLDVYALGATLFYMLTGKRPPEAFDVSSITQISSQLPSGLSHRISEAVLGAMRKDKHERTPSVKAFIDQIEKLGKLPLYYELKTNTGKYTVTEVVNSTDKAIVYRAVPTGSNIYDSNATAAIVNTGYMITEFFDRNECTRNDDYSVAGVNKNSSKYIDFLAEVKSKSQLFGISESNSDSNVNISDDGCMKHEVFFANGTCYLISRKEDKKPLPRPEIPFKKIFKFVGIFVAAAVVVIGIVQLWKIINPDKEEIPEPEKFAYHQALDMFESGDTIQAMKTLMTENTKEYQDSAQNKIQEIASLIGKSERDYILSNLNIPLSQNVDMNILKRAGECYQRLKKYENDYSAIEYTLDFSDVDKMVEARLKRLEEQGKSQMIPAAAISCYEYMQYFKPNDASIQAKIDKLKGE